MAPKKAPNVLGEAHFPVSAAEVDAWFERMDDVSNAIHSFLHSTPEEDAARVKAREERRRQDAIAADKERRRRRYDTRYYTRYESDAVIDALLAEADQDDEKLAKARSEKEEAAARAKESEGYSRFEIIALEEAKKRKLEGNAAVKAGDWTAAKAAYDYALNLEPVDRQLVQDLRNNRALVHVKLEMWAEAVEDATVVLQRERHNVKALLRRARGLVELHRPTDALQDLAHVLRAEKNNVEALALQKEAAKAEEEIAFADRVRADNPAAIDMLLFSVREYGEELTKFTTALSVQQQQQQEEQQQQPEQPSAGVAGATPTATIGAKLIMRTDAEVDEAVDTFALALCKMGTHLVDSGTATVFRLANGITLLLKAFYLADQAFGLSSSGSSAAAVDAPHARVLGTAGGVILVASLLRVLARALDAPTSVAIVCDDSSRAQRLIRVAAHVGTLKATDGDRGVDSASSADPVDASASMLTATAAVQLLAALASDSRVAPAVWDALTAERGINMKAWFAHWKSDPRCAEALRAVDNMLRVQPLQSVIVSCGWDSIALQAVAAGASLAADGDRRRQSSAGAKPSFTVRDNAASLLCRLSAAAVWREGFDSRDDIGKAVFLGTVSRVLTSIVQEAVQTPSSAHRDALATEALLAVLHNAALVAGNRAAVARAMDKEGLTPALVDLALRCYEPARTGDHVNIAARTLGVLGKVMLLSPAAEAAVASSLTLFARWLSFDINPTGSGGASLQLTQSEKEYRDSCVENAALIVASSLTKARDATPPNADLAIRLCSLPLEDGFGRLVSVVRSAPARAAGNAAMALSCLPALYPATVALAVQVPNFVQTFLDRIVSLRSELFELESHGEKNGSAWQGAKGAKRNIAIALSKYCGHETIMQAVRDLRGIEILYAAMDASDKDSTSPAGTRP